MGQYWKPVNLDKRETFHPHKLASGLKLWEIVASGVPGQALSVLLAAMPKARGGGDLDINTDDEEYNAIAKRTIGRWAGDRVVLVGDYAKDDDIPNSPIPASELYGSDLLTDISDDVCRVLEHELKGQFTGSGWRKFTPNEEPEEPVF